MLTKNINFIKAIKNGEIKIVDFTGFYRLYKIYKNCKIVYFHPAKVLCGSNLHLGFKSLLLRFLVHKLRISEDSIIKNRPVWAVFSSRYI